MRIAIWEIVGEDSGTLKVFCGDDGSGPRSGNLFALTSPTNQDLIVQGAVSEPATFALIGAALVALSLPGRKERRGRESR